MGVAKRGRGEEGQGEDQVLGEKRVRDGDARAERVSVDLLEDGEGFGACLEKRDAMAERRWFRAMHARCLLICSHCIAPSAFQIVTVQHCLLFCWIFYMHVME